MASSIFFGKSFYYEKILELVHSNLCGPMITKSVFGERYFMLFINEVSRMMWITYLNEKLEAFHMFKVFKSKVEMDSRKVLKLA